MIHAKKVAIIAAAFSSGLFGVRDASAQTLMEISGAGCIPVSGGGTTLNTGPFITYPSGDDGCWKVSQYGLNNVCSGTKRLWCPLPLPNFTVSHWVNGVQATVYNRNPNTSLSCVVFGAAYDGTLEGTSTASTGSGNPAVTLTFTSSNYDTWPIVGLICDVPAVYNGNYSHLVSVAYDY